MHGLVKKLANPKTIQFLGKLVDVLLQVDLEAAKPLGPWGMLRQMRHPDCRQGLEVMLGFTQALEKLPAGPA